MLGFTLLGCKTKISLSGATIPADAKTINIAVFKNNTTLGKPTMSQKFTERLRDLIASQSSLTLTNKESDLAFEGELTNFSVAPVALLSGSDQASQNRITISVVVRYNNNLEKKKNFEQTFTRFYDYSSSKTLNTVEDEATTEIFRQLSEDIFNRAFNDW